MFSEVLSAESKCFFTIPYYLLLSKNRLFDSVNSEEVKIANLLTKIGDFCVRTIKKIFLLFLRMNLNSRINEISLTQYDIRLAPYDIFPLRENMI